MKLLSMDDAKRTCNSFGIVFTVGRPCYKASKFSSQLLPPDDYPHLVFFANALLSLFLPSDGEFFLWIIDDDVWEEKATASLFAQVLSGAVGYPTKLNMTPGQMLDGKEQGLISSLFLLSLLGQWDALFVPPSGECFLSLSHHKQVEIHCKERSNLERLVAQLNATGISV